MVDIPLLGRSKKSFTKLVQHMPKEVQREWELLLHSILFKDEQTILTGGDNSETTFTGSGNYMVTVNSGGTGIQFTENTGANLTMDTSNFDNLLSSSDDNIQAAIDTLDDHDLDTHPVTISSATISSSGSIGAAWTVIKCAGNITMTLPTAASCVGLQITVKNIDTNTVTVDGNGAETIDGGLSVDLTTQYDFITVISDGVAWHIISQLIA